MKIKYKNKDNDTDLPQTSNGFIEDVLPGQVFEFEDIIYMKLDTDFLARYMNISLTHQITGLPLINAAVRLSPVNRIPVDKTTREYLLSKNAIFVAPLNSRIQIFAAGVEVNNINNYELVHTSKLN